MSAINLEFQCPSCTKRVCIEESQVGSTMSCTHCASIVRVPSDPSLLFHIQAIRDPSIEGLAPVTDSKKREQGRTSLRKWILFIFLLLLILGTALGGYKTYQYSKTKKQLAIQRHEKLEQERHAREAALKRIEEEKRLAQIERMNEEAEAKHLENEKQKSAAEAKQREQQEKLAAEAETKRLAEEKKKEEERQNELCQKDITLVRKTEQYLIPLLKQLQFKEANETLGLVEYRIKTKKGKDEYLLTQERIARIQNFHQTIATMATGYRCARGGIIESSNSKEITILGKKVLWSDIYNIRPEIVNDVIEGLVLSDQSLQTSSVTEKSKLITNAALCLYLFYPDNPSATDKSKRILARLLKDSPDDMVVVKKLFPAIVDDLSNIKYQPDCDRCKERYCKQCNGQKVCATCAGQGTVPCSSCAGQGQLQKRGRSVTCSRCGGAGARPGLVEPMKCMTCKGSGSLPKVSYIACASCNGKGRGKCGTCEGARLCSICSGTGFTGSACLGCGKN
jgi:hypothetical protein